MMKNSANRKWTPGNIAGGWLLPSRKRVVPYSIQWLKRLRPALFRGDLIALFELLGKGGVTGKIVLVLDGS
jgi:hypothetical protein